MKNQHHINIGKKTILDYIDSFKAFKKYREMPYEYKNYYDLMDDLRYAEFYQLYIDKIKNNKLDFYNYSEQIAEIIKFVNLIKENDLVTEYNLILDDENAFNNIIQKIKRESFNSYIKASNETRKIKI